MVGSPSNNYSFITSSAIHGKYFIKLRVFWVSVQSIRVKILVNFEQVNFTCQIDWNSQVDNEPEKSPLPELI